MFLPGVCVLRRGRLGRAKALQVVAGCPREDKNALPDRMRDLAFLELAILHGGKEVTQPAICLSIKVAIEFVPEHQRYLPPEPDIAYLMKSRQQLVGGP